MSTWLEESRVSDKKYKEMEKKNNDILMRIEEKNSAMDELKKDNKVKKYVDLFEEKTKLTAEKELLDDQLIFQRIYKKVLK